MFVVRSTRRSAISSNAVFSARVRRPGRWRRARVGGLLQDCHRGTPRSFSQPDQSSSSPTVVFIAGQVVAVDDLSL